VTNSTTTASAAQAANSAYPENHLYTGRINHRLAALYAQLERDELALAHAAVAEQIYATRDDVPDRWIDELGEIAGPVDPERD